MKTLQLRVDCAKLVFFSVIILLLKILAYWLVPDPGNDPIMAISPVFSFLNGHPSESIFAHSNAGSFLYPPVLSIVAAPFFYVFDNSTYSLFWFHILIIGLNILLCFFLLKNDVSKRDAFLMIIAAYLTSGYTYNLRPENIGIFLILLSLCIYRLRIRFRFQLIIISILVSAVGLMHPLAGIFAFALHSISLYFQFERQGWKHQLYFSLFIIISAFIISGGRLLTYVEFVLFHAEVGDHSFDYQLLPKYLMYNLPMVILLVWVVTSRMEKRFWVISSILFVGLISLFGRSYYFPYVLPLIALMTFRSSGRPLSVKLVYVAPAVLLVTWYFAVLPSIQYYENPAYSAKLKEIQRVVAEKAQEISQPRKLWVPGSLSMEVIDLSNARFHAQLYGSQTTVTNKLEFKIGDYIFVDNPSDTVYLSKILKRNNQRIEFIQCVEPVKGLITTKSLFKKRSDDLGLWKGELASVGEVAK